MAGKGKNKKKDKANNQEVQPQQNEPEKTQITAASEPTLAQPQIKPEAIIEQNSQRLQIASKVEVQNQTTGTIQKNNEIINQEVKDSVVGSELPIESRLGQLTNIQKVEPQSGLLKAQQSQIVYEQPEIQNKLRQIQAVQQLEIQPNICQDNGPTLQVIQEQSREYAPSNTLAQIESIRHLEQDNLPIQSQSNPSQVQVVNGSQDSNKRSPQEVKQAEEKQEQQLRKEVSNLESFVSIQSSNQEQNWSGLPVHRQPVNERSQQQQKRKAMVINQRSSQIYDASRSVQISNLPLESQTKQPKDSAVQKQQIVNQNLPQSQKIQISPQIINQSPERIENVHSVPVQINLPLLNAVQPHADRLEQIINTGFVVLQSPTQVIDIQHRALEVQHQTAAVQPQQIHQQRHQQPEVEHKVQTQQVQVITSVSQHNAKLNQRQQIEIIPQARQIHQNSDGIIDINQPIQIVSPKQFQNEENGQKQQNEHHSNGPELESRLFTLAESEQLPPSERSKSIIIGQSTEINPTKIQVRQSISFSDLNYSVDRSHDQQINIAQSIQSALPKEIAIPPPRQKGNLDILKQKQQQIVHVPLIVQQIPKSEQQIDNLSHPTEIKEFCDKPQSEKIYCLVEQEVAQIEPLQQKIERINNQAQLAESEKQNDSNVSQRDQLSVPESLKDQIQLQKLKLNESNLSQKDQLSVPESIKYQTQLQKQNISQRAEASERGAIGPEPIPIQEEVIKEKNADPADKAGLQPKQPKKKDEGSFSIGKVVIASVAGIAIGGLSYLFKLPTNRSLMIGAGGACAMFIASSVLVNRNK